MNHFMLYNVVIIDWMLTAWTAWVCSIYTSFFMEFNDLWLLTVLFLRFCSYLVCIVRADGEKWTTCRKMQLKVWIFLPDNIKILWWMEICKQGAGVFLPLCVCAVHYEDICIFYRQSKVLYNKTDSEHSVFIHSTSRCFIFLPQAGTFPVNYYLLFLFNFIFQSLNAVSKLPSHHQYYSSGREILNHFCVWG